MEARADISGKFEGELTATDKLIIRTSGRVSGKIRYNAIEIEPGGEISGDIQVTHDEAAQSDNRKENRTNEESSSDNAQTQKSKATG